MDYNYVQYFMEQIQWMEQDEVIDYVASMFCDGGIVLSLRPVTNSLDIDKLSELYDEFPWATQCKIKVPIMGSNGTHRYVTAR